MESSCRAKVPRERPNPSLKLTRYGKLSSNVKKLKKKPIIFALSRCIHCLSSYFIYSKIDFDKLSLNGLS